VRIFVRSRSKLEQVLTEIMPEEAARQALERQIVVIECATLEHEKLVELFTGAAVAMSFLGMVKPTEPVVGPGVESIVKALQSMTTPPKFLHMSSIGLNDGVEHAQNAWGCCVVWLALKVFLKACFDDLCAAEDFLIATRDKQNEQRSAEGSQKLLQKELNITIIRATILAGKDGYTKDFMSDAKSYKLVRVDDTKEQLSFTIDMQHVAEAFLDLASCADYDGENVSVFER